MAGATLAELLERMSHERAGVRRVAVIELARLADREADARGVVVRAAIQRLAHERDEKAALALVRMVVKHAREAGMAGEAAAALEAVYDDSASPVDVAVEAMRGAGELGEETGRRRDEETE